MQFFQEMTIPLLGRYNSAADLLFAKIIPRFSESETPIKHQLVAIAATQEQFNDTKAPKPEAGVVATKHYGAALKILADRSNVPGMQVMLISCLLSIALENFRSDTRSSVLHLQSGLQMLREWKDEHRTEPRTLSEVDEIIYGYIEPIFAQLEATAAMTGDDGSVYGQGGEGLHFRRPRIPNAFRDFSSAREKFFEIGYWLHTLNNQYPLFRTDSPAFKDLEELWDQWARAFNIFSKAVPAEAELKRLEALQLSIHYRTHRLTYECQSMPETESAWDAHTEVLRECIQMCADLNRRDDVYDSNANMLSTSFCRDPGILPPCWQTAVNCRDPIIRRRALKLMHEHHRRCGDADDCSAAAIAQIVINLEEEGLIVTSCEDVPESHRVRPLEGDLTHPGMLRLTYTRSPYVVPEIVEVPIYLESTPPVLPFKLFPMGESVRLAGYQGLVRPRTYSCRCKSYGIK